MQDLCLETIIKNMTDELGWESLESRRKRMRVQMLYKILNNVISFNDKNGNPPLQPTWRSHP